ncbi:hypothetical protein Tco_1307475, partial [Tanacetum coccineum]
GNPDILLQDHAVVDSGCSSHMTGNKAYLSDYKELCHVRHSHLMDEFDKFAVKEGESLESVYERLTTLMNIMDRNNVRPISVSINTKFLNCLQPEWSKYVTMVCHNQIRDAVSYDVLYDSLIQFKPLVLASKAKKSAKNHDPLALVAHSNASSSQSHANSSYSSQLMHKGLKMKQKQRLSVKIRRRLRIFRDQYEAVNIS